MNRTVKEVRSSTARRALAAGGLGLGLLVAAGSPALAQSASDTNYGGVGSTTTVAPTTSTTAATSATTSTTVRTAGGGTTQTQPPTTTATQVRGATQTRGATLPVTGGDAVGLSALGAGLVAAGVLAVKSSRRRSAAGV